MNDLLTIFKCVNIYFNIKQKNQHLQAKPQVVALHSTVMSFLVEVSASFLLNLELSSLLMLPEAAVGSLGSLCRGKVKR